MDATNTTLAVQQAVSYINLWAGVISFLLIVLVFENLTK